MLLYISYFEYLYTFTKIVPYDFQQLREIPSWIKLLNFQVAGGSKCSSHHSRLSLSGQCILLSYSIPTVTKNLISTLIIWCVHIKLRNFFCCPCFRSLLYCNWLDVRGRYGCWQIYVQLLQILYVVCIRNFLELECKVGHVNYSFILIDEILSSFHSVPFLLFTE